MEVTVTRMLLFQYNEEERINDVTEMKGTESQEMEEKVLFHTV